jgi:positive regulator of sigma E activity
VTSDEDIDHEERGIYLVIVGALIPVVLGTLLAHDIFDAGSTICLGGVLLAAFGWFSVSFLRRRRAVVPRARARK